MDNNVLAITIFVAILVLYISEKLPLSITSIIAMLAMTFSGILTPAEAFSGFGSTAVMMILGMSIIGLAFFSTGLADKIYTFIFRFSGSSEKKNLILSCAFALCLSIFLNPLMVITMFMPIVNLMEIKSGGSITRKRTYFPIAIAAVYGGTMTSVSLSAVVMASELLNKSSFGRGFFVLEPALISLPGIVLFFLVMLTFGYNFIKKIFTFPDVPFDIPQEKENQKNKYGEYKPKKVIILILTLIACIVCFTVTNLSLGVVAMAAASLLIITNCVDAHYAFKNVSWETIIVVGASIGFANGIEQSGAGLLIANAIITLLGPLGRSPFAMCVLVLFLSTFLSNFTSNTATVVIIMPIGLAMAESLGISLLPFALAAGVGASISVATPVSTVAITITTCAGYRFRDYLVFGGFINLLSACAAAAALYFVFFM